MQILLVEDDDAIADPLVTGLEREGYAVVRVATAAAAHAHRDPVPDVVLLDLRLPDGDGIDVCRRLRQRSSVPIIVVSARGDELDRVLLLEVGADDYLVKPFGLRELVARIRAVLRRSATSTLDNAASAEEPQRIGRLAIDRREHRVRIDGEEIELTPKEFALLALLAEDPGAVHTRGDIIDRVWDPHWYGPTKTLDVHVASLRKKLGDRNWIETVRGVGLRLGPGS